jgi:hypothetical protein
MSKHFVFIFRQGGRTLTEEEQESRTREVRAWAIRQQQSEHNLEPRVLGDERELVGNDATAAPGDRPVIAFNFIDAQDLPDAVELARTHPGLRYGVTIEVREWTDPRAASAVR